MTIPTSGILTGGVAAGASIVGMAVALDATTATILCAAVGSLVLNILQYLREGRAHRWMLEQSDRDAAERLAVAKDLKEQHVVVAARAAAVTEQGVRLLEEKIAENTEVSITAFKEANDVNRKIAAIGGMRARDLQLRGSDEERLKP